MKVLLERDHTTERTASGVTTAVLREDDHQTERLVLVDGVDDNTFLVALDLSRSRNLRLLGRRVTMVRCRRRENDCEAVEQQVRVCAPTLADLQLHGELERQLFPSCREVRPSPDLTLLRLELLP